LEQEARKAADEAITMFTKFQNWLLSYGLCIISAIIILIVGWYLAGFISKAIKKGMTKAKIDAGVVTFAVSSSKLLFKVLTIVIAAAALKIDISVLVTALGAATVTIGLALKDSLSNIASGTLILINKPFKVGDEIKVDGAEGRVKKIEIFFTSLITRDGEKIIIPNASLLSKNIVNKSAKEKNKN